MHYSTYYTCVDDLSGEHGIQNSSFEGLREPELENISTDGDISAKSSPKTPTSSTLTATGMQMHS